MSTAAAVDVLLVLPCQTDTEVSATTAIASTTGESPSGERLNLATHPKTSSIGMASRLGKHATSSPSVGKSESTMGTLFNCNCFSNPPDRDV
jgi:hypothetical protein